VSPSIFTRRRSERFAQLIEEAGVSRRHHARSHARSGLDAELVEFVSVSRRVRDLPLTVEAHPEFREGLRAMLLATIEREGIGVTAVRPEPETAPEVTPGLFGSRRTRTRTAVIAGFAAGTLALSGMSTASGNAIPGSALYGVKRSTERAQLALAGSDLSRGELKFQFARTRLDEAAAFRDDPARLAAVFDDMDSETQQGTKLMTTSAVDQRDSVALDSVDSFAGSQRQALVELRDELSASGQTRVDGSLTLLDAVQRRSAALRPLLPCGGAAATGTDELGPVPTARCRSNGQGAKPGARVTPKGSTADAATGGAPRATEPGGGQPDPRPAQPGAAGARSEVAAPPAPRTPAAGAPAPAAPRAEAPATAATLPVLTDGGGLLDGIDGLDEILDGLGFTGLNGRKTPGGGTELGTIRTPGAPTPPTG